MQDRKGIILAGGSGSRLYPITFCVSKHLLPIYDKPMIYYPLSVLMLAEIKDILIITRPEDQKQFKLLLGNGSQWGVKLTYALQPNPDGLAQALIIGEEFLDGAPSLLVLGDNIFFGQGLSKLLQNASKEKKMATVLGYHVDDPSRYGIVDFNENGKINSIVEKPKNPKSNYAITGIYFLDHSAPERAKNLKPSIRGELEITSLLETYLEDDKIKLKTLGRGYAWLDTGTYSSLLDANNFIRTMSERQGLLIGSPEEIAYNMNWINDKKLKDLVKKHKNNPYSVQLNNILKTKK